MADRLLAYSFVVTLAEVLPKPVEKGDEKVGQRFVDFLRRGKNMTLLPVSEGIAEQAGRLRGRYKALKTVDAIQVAAAMDAGTDVFVTNDKQLSAIREIRSIVLKDYL